MERGRDYWIVRYGSAMIAVEAALRAMKARKRSDRLNIGDIEIILSGPASIQHAN